MRVVNLDFSDRKPDLHNSAPQLPVSPARWTHDFTENLYSPNSRMSMGKLVIPLALSADVLAYAVPLLVQPPAAAVAVPDVGLELEGLYAGTLKVSLLVYGWAAQDLAVLLLAYAGEARND